MVIRALMAVGIKITIDLLVELLSIISDQLNRYFQLNNARSKSNWF